ncbi:hypothetical protein N0B31_06845 [Salinirubellus salinus]|uniref:DUF7282 domain-containing protein n=1 Tax=Salinirubellus salinus TaxID=1364945 RepID=A0A9E7R508_9EURY|nr:hypothetical protein [Salinirubellus salinus]UWM56000.1 hypothetical protein N0B31_06845 [Salinirubellus salinus]
MHRTLTVALFALLLAFAPMADVAGATTPTPAETAVDSVAVADAATTETASLAHPANVTITNQSPGGTTVVDEVYVADGGFVIVRDATLEEGGEDVLASVRGSTPYLTAGVHENVTVTLPQPIDDDSTLVAMPHRDTDGDRVYDFVASNGQADGPYVNAPADSTAGSIVVAAAEVTVELGDTEVDSPTATETMADEDPDPSTPDGSSGDGAGFGLVAALLAVVALALLARRY